MQGYWDAEDRCWGNVFSRRHVDTGPNEVVVAYGRAHWVAPIKSLSLKHLGMSGAMMIAAVASELIDVLPLAWWMQLIMWIGALGHSCWTIRPFMYRWSDLYIVTDKRLIRTGGLIKKGVRDYAFNSINNFYITTPVLGIILLYDEVRIVQQGGMHNQGADDEYCPFVTRKLSRAIAMCRVAHL